MSPTSPRSDRRAGPARTPTGGAARIGCSGWHYTSWRGPIYPEALPTSAWLSAYARRFSTVEINSSFYRLPAAETFTGWRKQVPRGFLFSVKASRFLTHIKRLRDPEEPLARLFAHARPLGPTLGPILYQLPPRWFPDPERLEIFLSSLPQRLAPRSRHPLRHVIEMRDPRGYEPWVIDLLHQYGVTLCMHDMPGSESPLVVVGPIAYVRFHGYGVKYGGSYPDGVLEEWAIWLRRLLAAGRDVYAYFNNDINGYAVHDAERLRLLLAGTSARLGDSAAFLRPSPEINASSGPSYPTSKRGRPVARTSAGDATDEPF